MCDRGKALVKHELGGRSASLNSGLLPTKPRLIIIAATFPDKKGSYVSSRMTTCYYAVGGSSDLEIKLVHFLLCEVYLTLRLRCTWTRYIKIILLRGANNSIRSGNTARLKTTQVGFAYSLCPCRQPGFNIVPLRTYAPHP